MRTTRPAPALLLAIALAFVSPGFSQEARPPGPPATALRARLDFARWQEMSPRERQTFVEGAVLTLELVSSRLKADLGTDARPTPERMAAVVRFVRDNYPRFPAADYLKEMDRVYLTAEGQNLSMMECFLQAFRRLNSR